MAQIDDNGRVDWMTIGATAIGAAAAIAGTVIVQLLVTRASRKDEHLASRRQSYLEFALGAEAAHDALRHVADPGQEYDKLDVAARRAVSESGIYGAREKLLVVASPAINNAAEQVLRRIGAMRHAIRDGAKLNTTAYHDVYHPLANALWQLRRIARVEFGFVPLKPEDLGKSTWDSQDSCAFCTAQATAASSAADGAAETPSTPTPSASSETAVPVVEVPQPRTATTE